RLARLAAPESSRLGARLSLLVRGALRRGKRSLWPRSTGRRVDRGLRPLGRGARPAPAEALETERSMTAARKAVVLARGIGSRMRREDGAVSLDPAQAAVAGTGL